MEGPGKSTFSASGSKREPKPRTVNPISTEAEGPLPKGKKASSKTAKVIRMLHEPLNPNATTTPITPSPTAVAQSPASQVASGDAEDATDLGDSNENPSSAAQGEMVNERNLKADRVQQEKKAKKDKKAEDRRNCDALAATAASLAQTRDIETTRAVGTRSSLQKHAWTGLCQQVQMDRQR